ncbi:MAG: hypothetical protein KDK78_08725, partial [Chlamydiia bacterium]|nr:hypothetical protein [Chlamydiia bacterium]
FWASIRRLVISVRTVELLETIAKLGPIITAALELLCEALQSLTDSVTVEEQVPSLARVYQITKRILRACQGLHRQLEAYEDNSEVQRSLVHLLDSSYAGIYTALSDTQVSAAIYRAIGHGDPRPSQMLQHLVDSQKLCVQQLKALKGLKHLSNRDVKQLRQTEGKCRRLWGRMNQMLWERFGPGETLPVKLTTERKQEIEDQLRILTQEISPVQVVLRLLGRGAAMPDISINGRSFELDPARKKRHCEHYYALLLAAVNSASILPADLTDVEAYAAKLTDAAWLGAGLKDTEAQNDALTDLPAPECVGKLLRLLQGLLFDARVLMGPKLGPLLAAVPPGEDALNHPCWTARIDIHGTNHTVSQTRDYVISDFMGKPMAYVTLEHDMWRQSGDPWKLIAVRLSYIRFHRGVNETQRNFVLDNLPIQDEAKEALRSSALHLNPAIE